MQNPKNRAQANTKTPDLVPVHKVVGYALKTHKADAVKVLRRNGMDVSENDPQSKVDRAFAALLPRSSKFRKEFAGMLTQKAQVDKTMREAFCPPFCNFLGFSGDERGFFNACGAGFNDIMNYSGHDDGAAKGKTSSNAGDIVSGPSGAAASSTPPYWRQVLSPELLQTAIMTGLNIWAAKKTGGTNGVNDTYTDINNGRGGAAQKPGVSPALIIFGVVAAVGLVGYIVYRVVKKKS